MSRRKSALIAAGALATVLAGAASFGVACAGTGLAVWLAALAFGPDAAARGSWWGEAAMAAYQVIVTAGLNTVSFTLPAAPSWIWRGTPPGRALPPSAWAGAAATLIQWTGLWVLPIRLLGDGLGRGVAVWVAFASPGLVTGLLVAAWVLLRREDAESR